MWIVPAALGRARDPFVVLVHKLMAEAEDVPAGCVNVAHYGAVARRGERVAGGRCHRVGHSLEPIAQRLALLLVAGIRLPQLEAAGQNLVDRRPS